MHVANSDANFNAYKPTFESFNITGPYMLVIFALALFSRFFVLACMMRLRNTHFTVVSFFYCFKLIPQWQLVFIYRTCSSIGYFSLSPLVTDLRCSSTYMLRGWPILPLYSGKSMLSSTGRLSSCSLLFVVLILLVFTNIFFEENHDLPIISAIGNNKE